MRFILLFAVLVLSTLFSQARKGDLMLAVRMASKEEAIKHLDVDDEYTRGFGLFDLQSKNKSKEGSLAKWKVLGAKSVSNWTDKERTRLLNQLYVLDSILDINQFQLNIPQEIVFIKSTMEHEGGAEGYTRGRCIVLKEGVTQMNDRQLREILLHELFHVISRFDAALRKDLYQLIGFTVCNEIELPKSLLDLKISNPDAPFKDSYIKVKKDDSVLECMMLLYAEKPYEGGSFFNYMKIGLVKLDGQTTKKVAQNNGLPIIYGLESVENFFEQIGFNTNYIIDPEEAMADNFVYAVLNDTSKPTQALLSQIRQRLQKQE